MQHTIRRLVRIGFAILLAWCGFTEAIQWFALLFFHFGIAGDWFLIPLTSDGQEVLKFLHLNPWPICLALLIFILFAATGALSLRMSRRAWWITVGCFGLYAAAGIAWLGRGWTPAYLAYDTARGISDYVTLVRAGRWTDEDERMAREAAGRPETAKLPTVVLIVGESLTTARMPLYGYPKMTTPNLSAWTTNGLEVLPPRRATASYTAKALTDLLVRDGVSFVKRMRRKGYHPVLLSGQPHWERYCGVGQMIFAACEKTRYLRDEQHGRNDFLLSRWAEDELASARRPLLLIVHLYGCHYPFDEAHPAYWTPSEEFDDYDLSVRVTDIVVSDILRLLPKDGILIFTSDHGESPDSPSCRNAADPDMWTVPLLVYPKGGLGRVPLF